MNIIPAIDLKNGQCVRLLKGDFNQITRYDIDPVEAARTYQKQGATELHLVDLDGAKNQQMTQIQLISHITQSTSLAIQTGGGIRTTEQIDRLLNNNVQRVVIGSLAVNNPTLVNQWLKQFGSNRIVIALDVRFTQKREENKEPNTSFKALVNGEYYCATQGWNQNSELSLWDCLALYPNLKYLLCTDINLDGTLTGPNFDLYQQIKNRYPLLNLQASGGIGQLSELQKLSELNIDSVIIGKALYEKRFNLPEALLC